MALPFPFTALNAPPDLYYLAPGFPPTKLTVPDLREILTKHGINAGRASRRADYVALFEDKIYARREYIFRLKAHGIDDVGATVPGVIDHGDADDIMMSGALHAETAENDDEEDGEPVMKKKTASTGQPLVSRSNMSPGRSIRSKSTQSRGLSRTPRARAASTPKPDDVDLRDLVSSIKSTMDSHFQAFGRRLEEEKEAREDQFDQLSEAVNRIDCLELEQEHERGESSSRKKGGLGRASPFRTV